MKRLTSSSILMVLTIGLAFIITFSIPSFSSESVHDQVAQVAYDFLKVVGLNNTFRSAETSTLEFDDASQAYVDISINAASTHISILIKSVDQPTLDDVVRYSIRTEPINKKVNVSESVCVFLRRLLSVSKEYSTVFQRNLEILENASIQNGTKVTTDGMIFSVSSTNSTYTLTWGKEVAGIPCHIGNYWLSNCIKITVNPEIGIIFYGNTWNKYGIGSKEVMITRESAVAASLNRLNSEKQRFIGDAEAELLFLRGNNGREASMMYPCWRVQIDYSKPLPGNVRQHLTHIWADTGELRYDADQGYYANSFTLAPYYDGGPLNDWYVSPEERQWDEAIAEYIQGKHVAAGYDDDCRPNATRFDIYISAHLGNTTFFVGHGDREAVDGKLQWFIVDSQPNLEHVYDKDVYYHSSSKPKFVFLWACHQGEVIGGWNDGVPYGMPYAYTRKADLSADGYHSPDGSKVAFLGFKNLGPWLTKEIDSYVNAGYWFLYYFYEEVVDYSIGVSLNYASNKLWGLAWDQCPLYQDADMQMRLYGDGSRGLVLDPPSPGGGCPFVYVWDGSRFTIENNLLATSTWSGGEEVEDHYRLEQNLVPIYERHSRSTYSLLIREFQQEHSYFDQVQLCAVDHESDVDVAVSPLGEILTYQDPNVPESAVDEQGTSWLQEVSDVDGNYYEGYTGSFLVLDFGEVSTPDAKLVMRADRPITKKSIHIQVLESAENWIDVVSIIPRTYWATEIINLSGHLPSSGDLEVRLYVTDSHKVDFVGLDMTPQAQVDIEEAHLLLAYHSSDGLVTTQLLADDDFYAELVPGQQVVFLFSATSSSGEQRTFIMCIKGYYYTITN